MAAREGGAKIAVRTSRPAEASASMESRMVWADMISSDSIEAVPQGADGWQRSSTPVRRALMAAKNDGRERKL